MEIVEAEHGLEFWDQLGDGLKNIWAEFDDDVGQLGFHLYFLLPVRLVEDIEADDEGEGISLQVIVTDSQQVASLRDLDAIVISEDLTSGSEPRMVHQLIAP